MRKNFNVNTTFNLTNEKGNSDSFFRKIKFFFSVILCLTVLGVNAQTYTLEIVQQATLDQNFQVCEANSFLAKFTQDAHAQAVFVINEDGSPVEITNLSGPITPRNWGRPVFQITETPSSTAKEWYVLLSTVGGELSLEVLETEPLCGPTIFATGTFSKFSACNTEASLAQSFTISALKLSGNLDITPPAGYEISMTESGTYEDDLAIPPSETGEVASTPVYIRLKTGNAPGDYNGDIAVTSTDATTVSLAIEGFVTDMPTLSLSKTELTGMTYTLTDRGPSVPESFTVSGLCLTEEITIKPSLHFEVSTVTPFNPSQTKLPAEGGTVWVRLRADLPFGEYNGEIEVSSGTAIEKVTANGSVKVYDCYNHTVVITNTDRISGTVCAIDECYTIYEIKLTASDDYYSKFELSQNGVVISGFQTSSLPGGVDPNGNTIVYKANENGNAREITLYLNTRNGQYILSGTQPDLGGYFDVKLEADKYTIQSGESVILTATTCPSGNYNYEWFENGEPLAVSSTPSLIVYPSKNGTKYHVVINGEQSNEVRILFEDACDGQITLVNWYDFNGVYTACATDECHTIYQLDINLNNDSHFAILASGKELALNFDGNVQLALEPNGTGDPGYRNTGGAGSFTYYLNTNTTPYTLSVAEPTHPTGPIVKITPEGGSTEIAQCDLITLNATVCPDDGSITYTYKWFRNGMEIADATDPVLEDIPQTSGTEYYAIAIPDGNESNAVSSNTVLITFAPFPKLEGMVIEGPQDFKLNAYEHEIAIEESIKITIPYITELDYTLQYRSLLINSLWRDTVITGNPVVDGSNLVFEFTPLEGAEYRIKAVDKDGCVERYSDAVLVRVIFNCENQREDQEPTILFYEDFGYFIEDSYYKNETEYPADHWTTNLGNEYWWASNPIDPNDQENHVQSHLYAGDDNTDYDWCPEEPKKRIQDGYYAIVSSPSSGGCGNSDFWAGSDHSNTNPTGSQGGMLFINCTDAPNTVVYKRKIKVDGCDGVKVLFSAFISNATIKGETPVNVRLDIWNSDHTRLIYSISSGDVVRRNQGDPNMWANLSFKFDADDENAEYILELTNNNPGGENQGNDIILDDISVMLCYPTIALRTTAGDLNINSCTGADTTVALKAINENGIEEYFKDPYFAFQYRNEATGNEWTDFQDIHGASIVRVDTIDINLNETFLGTTDVRLIVASSPSTIEKIKNGEDVELSCEDFYAIDSTFKIHFNFFVPEPIDTIICPGQIVPLPHAPTTEEFTWYLYLLDNSGGRSEVVSGNQDDLEQKYNAYFESLGDADIEESIEYMFAVHTDKCIYDEDTGTPIKIQRLPEVPVTHTIRGGLVYDPNKEVYVICENDDTGIIAASTEYRQPYKWVWQINGDTLKVNGVPYIDPELNMQTIIDAMGVFEGEITLSTTSYCTQINTIPFKIYRMFELELDATVQPDGGNSVCLEEGVVNEILLKATTVNSPDGEPAVYYWYIYQNGVPVQLTTTTDPEYLYRDETGRLNENADYMFEVRATDGVCRTAVSDGSWTTTNQDDIEVRLPVKFVSLEAENDAPICFDTQDIKYTLTVKNPRAGMEIKWSVNGVEKGTIIMETGKTVYDFYPPLVVIDEATDYSVSVHIEEDMYCNLPADLTVPYEVSFDKVEITSFAEDMNVCVDDAAPVTLKVVTKEGVAVTNYIWTLNGNPVAAAEGHDEHVFTIADLQLGENTVKVIAEGGCESDDATVTITVYEPVTLALVSPANPVFICSEVTVNYTINVTNTNGNEFNLTWNVGENSGSITGTGDGDYSVEVPLSPNTESPIEFSVNVCSEPLVVPFQIGEITIDLAGDPVGCVNEEIELNLTNPANADIVGWDTPDGVDPVLRNGKYYYTFTGTGENAITVYAKKGLCTADYSYTFNVEKPSVIELLVDQNYICQTGDDYVTMTVNVISGNPTAIRWSDYPAGEYKDFAANKSRRVLPLTGNEYYSANVIDDVCGTSSPSNTVDTTLYITSYPADFRIVADPSSVGTGDSVKLVALCSDDKYGDLYTWSTNGSWYKETDINELGYYVEFEDDILFSVETTIDNCVVSADFLLEVVSIIPDIITPYNNNGKNDVFMGPKNGKPGYRVEIYNRYQQLIFEGNEGWDGTYRGKLADPGTYFYRLFLRNGNAVKGTLEVAKF
jgi:gliding motility-associated-like protein